MIGVSMLLNDIYVYNLPREVPEVLSMFLMILIINVFISKASGYSPIGTFDRINFVLAYPVIEEITFRGLVLPVLVKHPVLAEFHHIPNITSTSLGIVITAFLFAVSHLQYYKLNSQSVRFMIFALIGGLVFGLIAQITESIVLTIPLHIAFNGSAAYYAYIAAQKSGRRL